MTKIVVLLKSAGGETLAGMRAEVVKTSRESLTLRLLTARGAWEVGDIVSVKPESVRPWVPALEES